MPSHVTRSVIAPFVTRFLRFSGAALAMALLLLALAPAVLHAQTQPPATVDIADIDRDGLADATIETKRLRIILSSKTGDISVYYLKGVNFEENLFPPILMDAGYPFASATIAPFTATVGSRSYYFTNYTIDVAEKTSDRIVVTATCNNVSPESGTRSDVALVKKYTFNPNGYNFEISYVLTNLSAQLIELDDGRQNGLTISYGPGIFLDPFNPSSILALKPEGHDEFTTPEDFVKKTAAGGYTGIGLKTTYFCMLIDAKQQVRLGASGFPVKSDDTRKREFKGELVTVSIPSFTLKPQEGKSFSFQMYFGPKLLDELLAIKRDTVTDYGFLSTVLLRILQFFNAIYPNFGMSIVFLTIVVRLLLYPLTLKSTKSMAQVQKLQPLVQDLKDRHRDDPQKFNEEVLKLYQKHNVNPLGGCLPMLLQLPILIALYNTINIAVELRKMPFLWMADLSKADPYLILPIAIAALMYYQQGTSNMDPQQQQMMAFMPMFMFVVTWSLPAGLLVYWFTSSIIGIIQQIQANRIMSAAKEKTTP